MTIQSINIGVSPNDNTGDDPRTVGGKINANFTNPDHAASREVGTSSGNIPDADALGIVGNTNFTSGNLQLGLYDGLGVRMKMKNKSGGVIGNGAIIAGSQIVSYFIDASGASQESQMPSGSWQNVSGSGVGSNNGAEFLRVS